MGSCGLLSNTYGYRAKSELAFHLERRPANNAIYLRRPIDSVSSICSPLGDQKMVRVHSTGKATTRTEQASTI